MTLPTGTGSTIDYRAGDVFIHVESPQRCFLSLTLTGPVGGITDYFQIAGCPVVLGSGTCTPVLNGAEAGTTGLLVFGPRIQTLAQAAVSTAQYTVLADWTGVVINQSALPVLNCLGDALVPADIATAIVALGAKVVTEPTELTEQVGGTIT